MSRSRPPKRSRRRKAARPARASTPAASAPPPAHPTPPPDAPTSFPMPDFDPVPVRARHDGWTPERQVAFIEALGESGCVDHACAAVGMSSASAYALRRRVDAQSFRVAWEFALDYAVRRLSDAAFSRALHGVSRPIFYKGEQIGERRHYDERLTMFILRYRDPVRYGAWLDKMASERHPDGAALGLARAVDRVADDAWADELGEKRRSDHPPLPFTHVEGSKNADLALRLVPDEPEPPAPEPDREAVDADGIPLYDPDGRKRTRQERWEIGQAEEAATRATIIAKLDELQARRDAAAAIPGLT
ncbi:hypothetical protein [Sphingomonas sp. ID0503]|uniref:hypothetical protein n=1 Tax=Sphingomonas sp. ID0503 TaxID=3399691 RepID=UPI003AFA1114